MYRFEEMWLSNEDYGQVVQHSWPGGRRNITSKLGNVSANLVKWADETFGSLPNKIKNLLATLKSL